jgi:hypothetical protein
LLESVKRVFAIGPTADDPGKGYGECPQQESSSIMAQVRQRIEAKPRFAPAPPATPAGKAGDGTVFQLEDFQLAPR